MIKTSLRYTILRIRQKISFMAFKKHQTVSELICQTIVNISDRQQKDGLIMDFRDSDLQFMMEQRKTFHTIIEGDIGSTFLTIMRLNFPVLKLQERQRIQKSILEKEKLICGE